MPITFKMGDLLFYVLITPFKAENSYKYCDIIPFFTKSYCTKCTGMSAIFKCCNSSVLKEVLVAGVVAKGFVEHDLKGKHHKRGGTSLLEAFAI